MKYRLHIRLGSALVLGSSLALVGCARAPSGAPAAAPLQITVSHPVEVRAHVWGYLDKVNFKEGALVKKGDVLFELDPRPYQALLNQANAKVAQDEAQLKFDDAEYHRNLGLVRSGVVTQ